MKTFDYITENHELGNSEVLKNNNYIINIKSIVISLFNDIFSYVIL